MKSGVYYLYEYKNNQKSRNVGFLKLSRNSESCFLQICARGISVFHGDSVSLCILYPQKEDILIIPCQSISCENHAITCKLSLSLADSKRSDPPNTLCGFLIELPNKNLLVAAEDRFTFSTQKCQTQTANTDIKSPSSVRSTPDSTDQPKTAEVPPVSTTEEKISIRKIQRNELSVLPRKFWNLANNRFLLHGYYNYNHLLLVEEDGHFLLGVPGIYDQREARAADLFGFPTFSESYTKFLNLSSEESSSHGSFGYWCKNLPAYSE